MMENMYTYIGDFAVIEGNPLPPPPPPPSSLIQVYMKSGDDLSFSDTATHTDYNTGPTPMCAHSQDNTNQFYIINRNMNIRTNIQMFAVY